MNKRTIEENIKLDFFKTAKQIHIQFQGGKLLYRKSHYELWLVWNLQSRPVWPQT